MTAWSIFAFGFHGLTLFIEAQQNAIDCTLSSVIFKVVSVAAVEKNLFLAPQWYHIPCFLIWECIFRFGSSLRLSGGDFLRHFDARKFHLPPLLSRNLSQNTSFSINFGYDCRSVLKHVWKSYDIFRDVHDSRKRVVGLIYTIRFVS